MILCKSHCMNFSYRTIGHIFWIIQQILKINSWNLGLLLVHCILPISEENYNYFRIFVNVLYSKQPGLHFRKYQREVFCTWAVEFITFLNIIIFGEFNRITNSVIKWEDCELSIRFLKLFTKFFDPFFSKLYSIHHWSTFIERKIE